MPKADIDILISARNQASTHLKDVARDSREAAKATNGLRNAGLDIAGSFLGLDEISSQIRDAKGALDELAESGNKAKLAAAGLKAGLVAIAGTAGFLGGQKIADWLGLGIAREQIEGILGVEKQRAALAKQQRQSQAAIMNALNPGNSLKAVQEQAKAVEDAIKTTTQRLQQAQREYDSEFTLFNRANQTIGVGTNLEETGKRIEALKETLKSLRQEQGQLGRSNALIEAQNLGKKQLEEAAAIKTTEDAMKSYTKSIQDQVDALRLSEKERALKRAGEISDDAAFKKRIGFLVDEKNRLKVLAEAQKENTALRKQAAQIQERITEKREAILDTRRKESAERQDALTRQAGPVSATQSRFLTRGVVQADPVLKVNETIAKDQKEIKKLMLELVSINKEIAENNATTQQIEIIE